MDKKTVGKAPINKQTGVCAERCIKQIEEAEAIIESLTQHELKTLETRVSGLDFEAAQQLLNTARFALDEARQWLEDVIF